MNDALAQGLPGPQIQDAVLWQAFSTGIIAGVALLAAGIILYYLFRR